jgi:hypothetical protein
MCARHAGELAAKLKAEAVGVGWEGYGPLNLPAYSNRSYLESPRTHLALDRLILHAHLSSRLGQRMGKDCVGADFASNVTLSGKLHGSGHFLILDDIRIDRVDDESTRNALNLALQVDPQVVPRAANIDVSEFVRKDVIAVGGSAARLDEFRIANITTRADAVVIYFDLNLSVP